MLIRHVRLPAPVLDVLDFDTAEPPEVNQRIAEILVEEWIIAFLRIGSAWAGPSLRTTAFDLLLAVDTKKKLKLWRSELSLIQSVRSTYICTNHKQSQLWLSLRQSHTKGGSNENQLSISIHGIQLEFSHISHCHL